MVVPEQVQDAVHDEQRSLLLHRHIVLARLPFRHRVGQHHFAEARLLVGDRRKPVLGEWFSGWKRGVLCGRAVLTEREDVGHLVEAAEAQVQVVQRLVVGDDDARAGASVRVGEGERGGSGSAHRRRRGRPSERREHPNVNAPLLGSCGHAVPPPRNQRMVTGGMPCCTR